MAKKRKRRSRRRNPDTDDTQVAVRNPRRRKNGAGLGAFIGSLGGAVVTGMISALGGPAAVILPLGIALSATGGAVGGHYGAPKDRQRRGAEGGGIGGAIFGPIGAALGGYIGGQKPDRRKNPSSAVIAGSAIAIAGVSTAVGVHYVMRKRRILKALPSKQPGATPDNQGASPIVEEADLPAAVLDAEILKGGVPLEPGWKTRQGRIYRDHYIRIDEDLRYEQPYIDAAGATCMQATVRWVVVMINTPIATGTLRQARACSNYPINALDNARQKILDQASLAAMDWIDIAYPKSAA